MSTETYPGYEAGCVWQSDTAKSYRCPSCHGWIRTQYEGDKQPIVMKCEGPIGGHTLEWLDAETFTMGQMCEAISAWMSRKHGVSITPRQVFNSHPSGELWHVWEAFEMAQEDSNERPHPCMFRVNISEDPTA